MYALYTIPIGLTVYFGISPVRIAIFYAMLAVPGNFLFYFAFRLGYNKRFKDQSLTVAQMSLAIAAVLVTQIYAGPVRGAYLFSLLIAFVFGCYKLTTRQLLLLSLASSVAYAATIPMIREVEGERFNLTAEIIVWITFSVFLPFLSAVAGSVSKLRKQLAISKAELAGLLEKVTELATRDELTGVYNRRWLMEMLQKEKDRTDREGQPFCICLVDLDHFKRINDTYGHSAGDVVLKSFAHTTARTLRASDVVARYGGEEFLLFLPNTHLELAKISVERVRNELALTSFEGLPPELRITMSVGIAQYSSQESISELISRADQATYRAKAGGRDRIELGMKAPAEEVLAP